VTASGFEQDATYSVFEALRPAADQTLDRAAFATYSLDLVAMAALVLSLSRAGEQELEAGPISLVDALEAVAPRIAIVYQKDRLKPAARSYGVLHMFDRRIHAVQPPAGSSYHPKFALARYLGPRATVRWKLWIGSRNLTGGQDREAGLLLVGKVGGSAGKRAGDVVEMARDLLAPVPWMAAFGAELGRVRWHAPDGVSFRGLQWRRAGQQKPFKTSLKAATLAVAVSPFVDNSGVGSFGWAPAATLLTTLDAATGLAARPGLAIATDRPPTFGVEMPVEPPVAAAEVDGVSLPEPAGLHAKLLLRQNGDVSRLWIGSANLTGRGMLGPNAEVMAELDVPKATAKSLIDFARDGLPFDPGSVEGDPELASRRAAERALDGAIAAVLQADLKLCRDMDGITLTSATSIDAFLRQHSLTAWLLTRPNATVLWSEGTTTVRLVRGALPQKEETVLVCFRAERQQKDCPARTWAQAVPFPGHDADGRDRAAKASYIGLKGAGAWVRSQLENLVGAEATTWTGARRWAGSEYAGAGDGLPLAMEEVLAAWAKDPEEFERRARRLEDVLAALETELAQTPEEERDAAATAQWTQIRTFWSQIRAEIGDAP
jgi:hypothetical protein